MTKQYAGGCVCKKVRYRAQNVRSLWYCHCEQCRRMTGNYMAAAQVPLNNIQITGEPKWFYVSKLSRYGFCSDCGSQLFWRNDNNDYLSITGGSLDSSQGLAVGGHIYTSEKADYLNISDREIKFLTYWSQPPQ